MSKILFFTAAAVATAAETEEIARLNALKDGGFTEVGIRNAQDNPLYGTKIESSDYVAGAIPTEYNALTDYGDANEDRPLKQDTLPATASIAAAGTQQLQVITVTGDSVLDLTIADVTATDTTYASDDTDTATVDSAGLVTGVAAGTAVITATHTYDTGKTETSTATITVT